MRIAIGHDLVERATDGNPQSFSAGWKGLADELGVEAEVIEPLLPGAIGRIGGFDGFIWRYNFRQPWTDAGPRIMAVVEDQHGLPVWPARVLRETFENKIAQAYVLDAIDVPRPRTWVFWSEKAAREALGELPLPLVAKLSRGVRGEGVALIRTREEAVRLIKQMFSFGLGSMEFMRGGKARRFGKYSPMIEALRKGRIKGNHERGYVIFQEFVEGNAFDTRVVIQGERAWASRRLNREGDFRASGSGVSEFDAKAISPAALALAWRVADAMGVRTLVADVMQRGEAPVMGEISYSMASHVVREMDGHWRRGPEGISWDAAALDWPRAVFEDFVAEVRARGAGGCETGGQ